MKHRNISFCLFFVVLFFSCVPQNYNTRTNSTDIVFYTLSKGETLSEFIENQNRMNMYAKYENVPTDKPLRDDFASYEELIKELLSKLSEEDVNEFSKKFSEISIEEFLKLNFIYTIYYNKKYKLWRIELIGRSTTLYLEYSSDRDYAYKNGLTYYNDLIPYINRWMDLNKIPSLEDALRININNNPDGAIVELYGISLNNLGID